MVEVRDLQAMQMKIKVMLNHNRSHNRIHRHKRSSNNNKPKQLQTQEPHQATLDKTGVLSSKSIYLSLNISC